MPLHKEEIKALVLYAVIMVLVIVINVLAMNVNKSAGTLLIPFSVFSVFAFCVRLFAPYYLKMRVAQFLSKNGGEADIEALVAFLALAKTPEKTLENEVAARDLIERLQEEKVVRIEGSRVRALR